MPLECLLKFLDERNCFLEVPGKASLNDNDGYVRVFPSFLLSILDGKCMDDRDAAEWAAQFQVADPYPMGYFFVGSQEHLLGFPQVFSLDDLGREAIHDLSLKMSTKAQG